LKTLSAYDNGLKRIESIYHEHKGRYGYRRIHLALINEGIKLNHKTVQRLMGQLNLKSIVRPKNIVLIVERQVKQQLIILKEILNHRDRMKNG